MATKAQVRNKALKKLRVLEEGETPTNEVISDVEGAYNELYAFLSNHKATTWDSDEEIPNEAVRHVVTLLAFTMADDFGIDEVRYQRLKVEAYGFYDKDTNGAFSRLVELAANDYVSVETEADYY